MFGLVLGVFLSTLSWSQSSISPIIEETLYYDYQELIQDQHLANKLSYMGISNLEQSLFVDALWDLIDEENPKAIAALKNINPPIYSLVEKLRLGILKINNQMNSALDTDLSTDLINALKSPNPDLKLIYIIATYEELLAKAGHTEIISLAKGHPQYQDIGQYEDRKEISEAVVYDLFHHTPDVTTYMNGEYLTSVKIFMFCRENRLYPCLMVMKNIYGQEVRNPDGTLWTHKALASSAKGIPSYTRNGNTPEGVHTIDSVMPAADQNISFGKYRRMILNFIPRSKNEVLLMSLLPPSSQNVDWWKASTVARDAGRNLLRIHGTGKINYDSNTPYYPFMRTSGCIAQRENTYSEVTYQDQRDLLDAIMIAMDMAPKFQNEPNIKGILYLIDIDDKTAPVSLDDLLLRGIE